VSLYVAEGPRRRPWLAGLRRRVEQADGTSAKPVASFVPRVNLAGFDPARCPFDVEGMEDARRHALHQALDGRGAQAQIQHPVGDSDLCPDAVFQKGDDARLTLRIGHTVILPERTQPRQVEAETRRGMYGHSRSYRALGE
jgi:hypothetical protein